MSALFDYDRTVRAAFGFALQYPTQTVWIVAVVLALLLADVVVGAVNVTRNWLDRR